MVEVVASCVAENPTARTRISPWWCVVRLPFGKVHNVAELSLSPNDKHLFQLLQMPTWGDGSLRYVRLIATSGFTAKTADPETGRRTFDVTIDGGATVHPGTAAISSVSDAAATGIQTYAGTASVAGLSAVAAVGELVGDSIHAGSGTVAGASDIAAAGIRIQQGQASVYAVSGQSLVEGDEPTFGFDPSVIRPASAAIAAVSAIHADGVPIEGGVASVVATSAIAAVAHMGTPLQAVAAIASTSELAAQPIISTQQASAAVVATSAITGMGRSPNVSGNVIELEGRWDYVIDLEGRWDDRSELTGELESDYHDIYRFQGGDTSPLGTGEYVPFAVEAVPAVVVPIAPASLIEEHTPTANDYVVTTESNRLPGESTPAIWAETITVRDPDLPFTYFWHTIGFSIVEPHGPNPLYPGHPGVRPEDPTAAVTHGLWTNITFPIARSRDIPGGKVGVYHPNTKAADRVVTGNTEHFLLIERAYDEENQPRPFPAEGYMQNGQANAWRGALTEDLTPYARPILDSALAAIEGPIYAVCTTGHESYGSLGVVPPAPTWYGATEEARALGARAWVHNRIAVREAMQIRNPWYGDEEFSSNGFNGYRPFYGSPKYGGQAGGAPADFGNIMNPWMAVRCAAPRFLELVEQDVMQEWCRPQHMREHPTFRDGVHDGPATPYRLSMHPNSRWRDGNPAPLHELNVIDGLGKFTRPPRNTNHQSYTSPPTDWWARISSHQTRSFQQGFYMLTGDWGVARMLQDHSETVQSELIVGEPFQTARHVWRSLLEGIGLVWCTNNGTLRGVVIARILQGIRARWQPALTPFAVVKPTYLQTEFTKGRPGWSPYQNGGCAVAYFAAQFLTDSPGDRLALLNMALDSGESNMAHAYENVLHSPGNWRLGKGVPFWDGTPQNGGTAAELLARDWGPESDTGPTGWNQGIARIIAVHGRTQAAQALGVRNSTIFARDSAPDGETGWDKYADWFFVVPP